MEIVKVVVSVQTNRVGSKNETEIEVQLNGDETPEERERAIEEVAKEAMFEMIEWNWYVKR
jgi:uncharacterized OsmC-like protein